MKRTFNKNRPAGILFPIVFLVFACLATGCSTTSHGSGKNVFAFPSFPKWKHSDPKPKKVEKDPTNVATVEEFLAAPSVDFF